MGDMMKPLAGYVSRAVYDGKRPLSALQTTHARRLVALATALDALEMVRDADEDCRKDGLQAMPSVARATVDRAIAKLEGCLG
jgi:hypothetical protein